MEVLLKGGEFGSTLKVIESLSEDSKYLSIPDYLPLMV